MKKYFFLLLIITLYSCNFEKPTSFSKLAKKEQLLAVDGTKTTLHDVLQRYKGNKVVIDFWASWCADCFRNLPALKKLQQKYPSVIFMFISVDKNFDSWKAAIQKHNIDGDHYNLPKGKNKGDLVDFVNLFWIPRYMVLDEKGNIVVFKSTKITDLEIEAFLK